MKYLKNIVFVFVGIIALILISISGTMLQLQKPVSTSDYIYVISLVLSIIYLHWALRNFLMPIQVLSKEQIKEVQMVARTTYAKGFFTGTVFCGYLLLGVYIYAFFDRNGPDRPEVLLPAIFLIALGTLAQTRAVVKYLCNTFVNNEKRNQISE